MASKLSLGSQAIEEEASEIGWVSTLGLFRFSMAKMTQRVFFVVISPKHTALMAFLNGCHTLGNSLRSVLGFGKF